MKLSYLLLSSILVYSSFACKREDGPLSPEAGTTKKPATPEVGTIDGTPKNPDGTTGEGAGGTTGTGPGTTTTETPKLPLVNGDWAHSVAATLQSFYNPTTALYRDTWDVSAHSLSSLIDFMKLSGSREYMHIINKVYEMNKANNFITDSSLSNALWANTWIRAFDLIGDRRYLETAKILADEIEAKSWDDTLCGGGIRTSSTVQTKTSAATLAYIYINGALHNRIEGDTKYFDRASKGWVWFLASGMFNGGNLVNNGQTSKCKNDGLQTWTHSQGFLLAAALELYKTTQKTEFADVARKVATAAMTTLAGEGVLREANDKSCGSCLNSERIYKGIFIRSLREIQVELKDENIGKFIEYNILKVWNGARSTGDAIGFHWQSAFDSSDAGRQASALDLINAGILSNKYENIALNRVAQTTENCATNEAGAQALDGSAMTKWCSYIRTVDGASMIVDLGSEQEIHGVKILHGAAGGESVDYNTRNFAISIGNTATGPWKEIVSVTDNTSSATFHIIENLKSRFIRLQITKGGSDNIARIYEFTVD